ncbi:unnamed protein product [Caenorhabditis nigoni]
MPIRLLSLPISDLQYALNCMDIVDLIAFSLCSKRTKSLVKDSKIAIEPIYAEVYESRIFLEIRPSKLRGVQNDLDKEFIFLDLSDYFININSRNGIEVLRKPEFTQSDWLAHFLSIFNETMIHGLSIENVDESYLDTIKRIIPKCKCLQFGNFCSDDVAKIAFFKLAPIAVEHVVVQKNIFDHENDVSKFLTRNLKSVFFSTHENPLELKLNDLLVTNVGKLTIINTKITEKELNRFLKLWMKGNHTFYRPKYISLTLEKEADREEVSRGIKCKTANYESRLKRADGKVLLISIRWKTVVFDFQ